MLVDVKLEKKTRLLPLDEMRACAAARATWSSCAAATACRSRRSPTAEWKFIVKLLARDAG